MSATMTNTPMQIDAAKTLRKLAEDAIRIYTPRNDDNRLDGLIGALLGVIDEAGRIIESAPQD